MSIALLYARRLLKRPFVLLISIVMPLLLVQGVVLQYNSATKLNVNISVPDKEIRDFVVNELTAAKVGYTEVTPADRSGARGALLAIDGTAAAIPGHPDALGAKVSYGSVSANNVLLASRLNTIASTLADLATNSPTHADFTAALAAYAKQAPAMTTTTTVIGNVNSTVLVSSFNMIVFVMLLLTMSNIVMFLKDKELTTTQRILVAARSKLSYVVQLVALFAVIAVVEFLLMLAAMTWLFHVDLGISAGRIGLLVAAYALFNVVGISLGLLLVSRTTKESVGRLLVTAVTLPMAMLGGALWPLSIMPDWMQHAAQVLPTTWITSLNGTLFSGFAPSTWELLRPTVLLAGLALVLFGALSRLPSDRL